MFSAYLRSKFYSPQASAAKKLVLLGCSLPTKELFCLRGILSNSFTEHPRSTLSTNNLPDPRKKDVNRSFTFSYLVDSCGLSPAAATRASQRVHFATPEKPDSVLSLLRSHGFSKSQVAVLVSQHPRVLVADAEKTLLPRLQFYQSIGFSETNLAKTVTFSPNFLRAGLKNTIIPTYTFLKSVLHSDEKVCRVFQRFGKHSISKPCTKSLVPNIALLRKLQVPETCIASFLTRSPRTVDQSPEEFSETLSRVMEMGICPSKFTFVLAVNALSGKSSRAIWDRSCKIYTKWGWSNDEILLAFKKQPDFMLLSEKKITGIMEFLVNTMGWHSREIAAASGIFTRSLEKRIIPRCSVIRLLSSNGLLKKKYKVDTVVKGVEKSFIKMFVTKYEAHVPGLMSFYQGKRMDALTVSYLVDSCGLSPAAAARASQMVHFATPEKPDSALAILRNYGLSKSQVAVLVSQHPRVLVADAEKTLLPRLQFYQSIGFSETNLAKTVTFSPNFLRASLKNTIIPTYTFLKSVLHSDEKVCRVLQKFQKFSISKPCTKSLVPNIALLRKLQVPETCIASLLTRSPWTVDQSPEEFSETVSTVMKMGFSPSKLIFVQAVNALSGKSSRAIWDRCYKTYTKWGWSNDEILLAFKKQPQCMLLSEKKITGIMEFLVNTMGWHSREIAAAPDIFTCSLEKKIIPRCSVIGLLSSNGLLKKKYKVNTVVKGVEKSFIKMFVTKYEAHVPGLMSFYQWMLSSQVRQFWMLSSQVRHTYPNL